MIVHYFFFFREMINVYRVFLLLLLCMLVSLMIEPIYKIIKIYGGYIFFLTYRK